LTTEKPKRTLQRRWFVLVGVLISAIFLYLALRGLQPDQFINSLSDINVGWLIVGALTYFLAVVIIAARWQFLLQTVKRVPIADLTQIVMIGYMGNNVYPLRAGEALRIYLLKRNHDMPVTSAATTVVVERVFDGIVMLSFLFAGLLWVDVQSEQIELVARVAAPIFGIAVIVFFTLAAFPNMLNGLVKRIAAFFPDALANIILKLHDEVLAGLSSLRSPLHLLGAIITSYATWAVEALVYWIVMWAFGLDLPYGAALLVVGTVNLAGLIPASPGQIGVYEFFASTVMGAMGVEPDMAIAYAIVVHIVIWLPVTLVGFLCLIGQGLGWSAITSAPDLNP
jgi:uncharacterized protein (TIRG00374 family)